MASFNQVTLIGNLTRDPELKHLPKGTAACHFAMAVNRKWKTDTGEEREEVYFADCKCFGRTAETIAQYVKKGSPLFVQGRLTREEWEAKDGTKKTATRIMVESFQFLGGKDAAARPQQSAPARKTVTQLDLDDEPPF